MARPKKDRLIPPAENVITVLRMRNGLTQQQLADACGLTVIDVGKMERKDYKLQLCKLQTLAAFFRISLDTIVHDRLDLALANLRAPCEVDQDTKLKLRSMQLKRLDTGLHGEDLVYEQERQKLAGTPYANAVDLHYAFDSSFGFDLLSFTPRGELLYIEVKSTSDSRNVPFFMSAAEKSFMAFCATTGRHYELHRIYNIDNQPKRVIYTLEELRHFTFVPNEYLVKKENNI